MSLRCWHSCNTRFVSRARNPDTSQCEPYVNDWIRSTREHFLTGLKKAVWHWLTSVLTFAWWNASVSTRVEKGDWTVLWALWTQVRTETKVEGGLKGLTKWEQYLYVPRIAFGLVRSDIFDRALALTKLMPSGLEVIPFLEVKSEACSHRSNVSKRLRCLWSHLISTNWWWINCWRPLLLHPVNPNLSLLLREFGQVYQTFGSNVAGSSNGYPVN